MVTQSWMYDAILYLYALSLLFYFSDFAYANRSAKRIGTGLLVFVWTMQTAYFAVSMFGHSDELAFTMFESLFLFSWLLVTLSLAIRRFFQIEMFVFFVNVVGFASLALHMFSQKSGTSAGSMWGINEELLFLHVTLAVCSYAAFCIAAVFSGMYLFLHRRLKDKMWSAQMKRLPSLEKIDHYANAAIVIGAPMLVASLSLGLIWVVNKGDLLLLADAKVVSSFFTLSAYVFYFILRQVLRMPGHRLALWNIGAFVIVALNFVVTNIVSGFHRWMWM